MKKIIGGKKYDTETAKAVASSSHGALSDFAWYQETLYRKKTGEFFLLGEGHAASRYACRGEYGGWDPGSKIVPVDYESARKWAEEELDADLFESIFGEVSEGGEKTSLNLSMDAGVVELAKRAAAKDGISVSAYVESLIKSDQQIE